MTDTNSAQAPKGENQISTTDVAILARGGRVNFFGFFLRLVGRLPFLYFASRWYGPEALGRFAYAILVVEFAAQLAALGLKRGLAEHLSRSDTCHRTAVWDGMFVALIGSAAMAGILFLFPWIMFPSGTISDADHFLPLVIFAVSGTDVALAACAYRFNVGATVWARSLVEPWIISIAAIGFFYVTKSDGLILSYAVAMAAAYLTALVPTIRHYGWPREWRPHPTKLIKLMQHNAPLAAADAIEWGTRRLDLAILGLFTSPSVYGVYYAAQQVASLPQKLKTSFDPILGPVITRNLAKGSLHQIAAQVSQVGFWIIAVQIGIAIAIAIPGEAVMGLLGPEFVIGAFALGFLLFAEIAATTAVVCEATLVYVARHRNLLASLATVSLQAILSVLLLFLARALGLGPAYYAGAVAFALILALGFASFVKSRLLSRILGEPINCWRWILLWASAGAAVLGWSATRLPEWAELIFGVPLVLGVYGWIIWTRGFDRADRALFRSKAGKTGKAE